MENLDREGLKSLVQTENEICVSMFMPTHRKAGGDTPDPIQFKNLLKLTEQKLDKQLNAKEVRTFLKPLEDLLADSYFWSYQEDGLSLFISPNIFRFYRLPISFETKVLVTNRFHIKPLVSWVNINRKFFLLTISQNQARFYRASPLSAEIIEVEGMPSSVGEALRYDEPERQVQFHTGTQKFGGGRAAVFHGQRDDKDQAKTNLERYCRQVAKSLSNYINEQSVPMVIAGVEEILGVYQESNTYGGPLIPVDLGNPDKLEGSELLQQIWPVVENYFLQEQNQALSQYERLAGGSKTSMDEEEIVLAAHQGRVETAFLASDQDIWGTFNQNTENLQRHFEYLEGDDDLLNIIAAETIKNRGTVFTRPNAEMPANSLAAAIYRY